MHCSCVKKSLPPNYQHFHITGGFSDLLPNVYSEDGAAAVED